MVGELIIADDDGIVSGDGWAVHVLGPTMLEYCYGSAACLVNVGYAPDQRTRKIFATESLSDLFPHLREHLQSAASMLQGQYVVV